MGLVCMAILATDNSLYEDGCDSYRHVTIAKEMGIADLDFVRYLNSQIIPGMCYLYWHYNVTYDFMCNCFC